uniref:Uncharacterized protein n=1 Tax=Aplanochytrium stocchinoi TaxID=215587 RepID=A0A7S3PPC3_9STRA
MLWVAGALRLPLWIGWVDLQITSPLEPQLLARICCNFEIAKVYYGYSVAIFVHFGSHLGQLCLYLGWLCKVNVHSLVNSLTRLFILVLLGDAWWFVRYSFI